MSTTFLYSFLPRYMKCMILLLHACEPWRIRYSWSSGSTKATTTKKTYVSNMSVRIKWTAHIQTENCASDSDANKVLQQRLIVLLITLAEGLKIVSGIDRKKSAGELLTWRIDVRPRTELSWIVYEPWGVTTWCQSHLCMYVCAA